MADPLVEVVEIYPAIEGEGVLTGTPEMIVRFNRCNRSCIFCDEERTWKDGVIDPTRLLTFADGVALFDKIDLMIRSLPFPLRWVSLTGGEPLARPPLQLLQLCAALKGRDYQIAVQTNGSINASQLFGFVDFWSVTPTLAGSGESALSDPRYLSCLDGYIATMRSVLTNVQSPRGQIKFVMDGSDTDIEEANTLVERWFSKNREERVPIIVQPVWPKTGVATKHLPMGSWSDIEEMRYIYQTLLDNETVLSWPNVRVMLQQHKVAFGPGVVMT